MIFSNMKEGYMKRRTCIKKAAAVMSVMAVGLTTVMAPMVVSAKTAEDMGLTLENIQANDYVLYTVNCGTPDSSVVPNPESERMGLLQSNVDQEYGEDPETGITWGRNPANEYSQAVNSGDDATDIGNSFIYMSDGVQFDKYKSSLGYSFEVPTDKIEGLEENTYEVTVAFKHYWDNRTVNILLEDQTAASDISVNYGEWVSLTYTTTVTDGELNVDIKSPRRTSTKQDPILNYIKVRAVEEQTKEIPTYSSFTGTAGETMYDTNGNQIQAHGGQIQQFTVDGETKWYWIGEDKTNDYRPVGGIHVYSSDDLYNWTDEGVVLRTMENPDQFETDPYFNALYGDETEEKQEEIFIDLDKNNCVIERPKMLYNEKNDNYVIWFHADGRTPTNDADYGKAKAGVAVSDSPTGPFKLLGTYKLQHAGDNYGYDGWENRGSVRDMNLFKDDDGTAYVIYSSEGNETMYVAKLNEDYTYLSASPEEAVEGVDFTRNFAKWSREAPAMFKYKDKYYVITSGCTGWSPNQAKYAVADHPMGPWTEIGDPCTDWGWETTYDTQSTCVFPVDAENGKFIYMGDRWNAGDLSESRYVWLPVEFQPDNKIALRRYENWTLEDLENKGLFEVTTELPTTAASVSEITELLPDEVMISYGTEEETTPVEWSVDGYGEDRLGTVYVTGNLTEKGRSFQHTMYVIDPDTKYFFDSGAEDSAYFNAAKEELGEGLLNSDPDPKYSEENKAGYTGTTEAESPDDFDMGLHEGGTEMENGWWAASGRNIEYAFELQPGTYTLAAGFQEWWAGSTSNRDMKLTLAMNGETLAEQDFSLWDDDVQIAQEFTVAEAGTVTATISKNGGSDQVLSWMAVTGTSTEEPEEPEEVDKTSLNMAIAMAEEMEKEQEENHCYTEESWAAVQTALDAARALAADPEAAQEAVDNAFLELITACNLLENEVQRVGLEAAIEGAKAILADEEGLALYTPESVEALRIALAEAERVFAEEGADQETVNAATRQLLDAVTSLVVVEQDTRLDILIQKAEELLENRDQYTSASAAALEQALEAAKAVAENDEASDSEINDAYNALAEAMSALVRKADKSELKNALDKANDVLAESDRYVEDTIAGLAAALETAQAVFDDEAADAAEVGQAVKDLVNEILKARLLGDVDGNGAVDTADSAEVLKYASEYTELTDEQQKAADVNRDGNSDSDDAAVILQYASGKIDEF